MKHLKLNFIIVLGILIAIILPSFSFAATEVNTVLLIKEAIATWYYIIRFISVAVMLVVLIFIGIKIALSNIASDRAFYKRMLMDWVAGMILVFGIHYIMLFIIEINELIVDMVSNVSEEMYEANPAEYGGLDYKEKDNEDIESSIFETVRTRAYDPKLINGTMGMVMYIYLVYYAYKFSFIYLKRYLTVGVLTLMAPAVAVSYAFTKVLTGKTKIFSTWLKEYFFNVILQSIHAIIYVTFVMSALKLSLNSISGMLLSFILLNFMSKADKIFRTIFGIGGQGGLVDDINSLVEKKPKELAEDIKTLGTAYLGNKAIRSLGKKEREVLFVKPAQKAFGGAMAFRANHFNGKNKKFQIQNEDGTTENTEFLEDDVTKFKNNKQLEEILDLEYGKFNEKTQKYDKKGLQQFEEEAERNKDLARKEEEELQRLIAEKRKALEAGMDTDDLDAKIKAKEADIEELTHERKIHDLKQELEIKKYEFSKSKEAVLYSLKENIRNTLDYEKYTEKVKTRRGKEKYVGAKSKYVREHGKRVKVDGIDMRIKENINAQSILGYTKEDEELLKENLGEIKSVAVGFFSGLFSLALFIDSPMLATGIAATATYSVKNKLLDPYLSKNKANYIFPNNFYEDKALTVKDIMYIRKEMSKQLNNAKDEYIVNSINKKHHKFVKLLTKGTVIATSNVTGSRYIRKLASRKNIPEGSILTRTGGLGYAEREHAIKQFYAQDEANKKIERAVQNNTFNPMAENSIKENEHIINNKVDNMSLDDTLRELALGTSLAVAVNGIFIPTTDEQIDGNNLLEVSEGNTEVVQQDSSVTDMNSNIEENKQEASTTVIIQGKTLQVTDKQIESVIVKVAKDNKYKSVTEFTSKEKNSHEIIRKQIENELIKKQSGNGKLEIPEEELKVAMSAIDEKIEKSKAKIVVGEITTESFGEVIRETDTTRVEDIQVGVVTQRAEQKLQDWVQINNEQIQERNPALKQLASMKKTITNESEPQLPNIKTNQTILGDKSIEQVMSGAVQAKYHSVSKFNRSGISSTTTEENAKKLKDRLKEKKTEELQDLLINVMKARKDEEVNKLLETVPTEQRELAVLCREIQSNNIAAEKLGMKKRKHLEFEFKDSSSAIDSLNKLADQERRVKDTFDSSVKDTFDTSVREQDTRAREQNTKVDSSRENKRISSSKKIDPKITPGVEGPLTDLNKLLATLNS